MSERGYIQAAFRAKHGMSVADWLKQHGRHYTLRQAAEFIGYSALPAFRTWLDKYAPEIVFKQPDRRKTSPLRAISDETLRRAMDMHDQQGNPWHVVAATLGVNVETLRQNVRKYGK